MNALRRLLSGLALVASPLAFAGASGWSEKASVPAIGDKVFSPDGSHYVLASEEGLFLGGARDGALADLHAEAMAPLWEVSWSPDSRVLQVTSSDGGAVGTWNTRFYALSAPSHVREIDVSTLVRVAAPKFADCPDEPADLNVMFVRWSGHGAATVMAQVPPHSSCRNMGERRTFAVSVPDGRVTPMRRHARAAPAGH